MLENHSQYFKRYRNQLGFSNQDAAKEFLAAKNITPSIDYNYIDCLNSRIFEILCRLNSAIHIASRATNLEGFFRDSIVKTYEQIKQNGIIPRLNNQGRRPEEVLFSWLRGYAVMEFFTPIITRIFNIPSDSISNIGNDDFSNIDTFKRTPQADLQFF